jgi:hypothetical protein
MENNLYGYKDSNNNIIIPARYVKIETLYDVLHKEIGTPDKYKKERDNELYKNYLVLTASDSYQTITNLNGNRI